MGATGLYERFKNRMSNDVFPVIGAMQPRDIQPVDVTRAIVGIAACTGPHPDLGEGMHKDRCKGAAPRMGAIFLKRQQNDLVVFC